MKRTLFVGATAGVLVSLLVGAGIGPAFADEAPPGGDTSSSVETPAPQPTPDPGLTLITGFTAPTVTQPKGSLVASGGKYVWRQTVQGTITVPAVEDGTWIVDGALVAGGSATDLDYGTYLVKFVPDAGFTVGPADVPATGTRAEDGSVTFSITLFKGADGGAAKVAVSKAPTISGTAQVGKTLTANIGTITPSPAMVEYQWLRNGTALAAGKSKTYTPTSAADVGKKLSVRVTITAPDYTTYTRTSAQTAAVKAGTLSAPTPTITGTARVPSRLTAKPGTWTSGTTLRYQWYAGGKAVGGQRNATFVLGAAHVGKVITVKVTGSKSGYTTAVRTSKGTAKVARGTLTGATPTVTVSSSVAGYPVVGGTLKAKAGSWTSGTTVRYYWYANGAQIKGATKSTFKIPAKLAGKTFYVRVVGTKAGYNSLGKNSAKTKAAYNPNSVSAKNAIASAKDYVKYLGNTFSRTGLIDQLKYEKFSTLDATYAVDSLHLNWNTAAANSALSYMLYVGGFSYGSMVDQLIFEGFTPAQAAYGARAVGL